MLKPLSRKSGWAPAAICRCGCDRLILFLKLPPERGGDPRAVKKVACYSENWDGNPWFTGQVRRHPRRQGMARPWVPPVVAAEDRLE